MDWMNTIVVQHVVAKPEPQIAVTLVYERNIDVFDLMQGNRWIS